MGQRLSSQRRAFTALLLLLARGAGGNLVSITQRYTADPGPLVVGDRVFLYTTHDITNVSAYLMRDYSLVSSTDLVNFEDHGIVFDARSAGWGPGGAWAQQVIGPVSGASDGRGGVCSGSCFYMFWPNMLNHSYLPGSGVGIALSSTGPLGPFVDITPNKTAFMPGDDPTVFADGTGTYLCSNPGGGPFCGKLASDLVSWELPPRNLSGFSLSGPGSWFEAPWLMSLPGEAAGTPTYVLTYMCPARFADPSLGHYGQDICIATCDAANSSVPCPLGNWTVQPTPLFWNPPYDCTEPFGCSNGGGQNAHHGIFELRGRYFVAYHTRLLAAQRGIASTSYQRNVGVDAAYVDPAPGGTFLPVTATPSWLRQLAWVDPYGGAAGAALPAALMAGASDGVDTAAASDSAPIPGGGAAPRPVVFPAGSVAWTRVAGVDFGASGSNQQQQRFNARVQLGAGAQAPASLALALDEADASPAAACAIAPDSAAGWATVSCALAGPRAAGVRDAFLVADTTLAEANLLVAWWFLAGGAASGDAPPAVRVPCRSIAAKANGLLLVAPTAPGGAIAATGVPGAPGAATAALLVDNEDGTFALSFPGVGFACANATGAVLTAAAASPTDACARFTLLGTTDGSYALAATGGAGGRFVAADVSTGVLAASADDPRHAAADSARFWLTECGAPLRS